MTLRILKYLSLGLLGLTVLLALVVAVIILSFDDQDYQRVLVEAVDLFSDQTLEINGSFHVEPSLSPSVSLRDLVLDSSDGSHSIRIDKLVLKLKLRPLLMRRLVISQLSVDGMEIGFVQDAWKRDKRAESDADILIPVIKRADLHNVTLNYQQSRDDVAIRYILDELTIRDVYTGGPVSILGRGIFDGMAHELEGKLGGFREFYNDSRPWPVSVMLSSKDLVLAVNGDIRDPSTGQGLNLAFTGDVNDLAAILKRFGMEAPQLGKLRGAGTIYGDINAPGLRDLKLALSREQDVTVSAEGVITDLWTGNGMEIRVSGVIDDPEVIAWKIPEEWPKYDWMQIAGTVRGDGGEYRIEDLELQGSTQDGLEESYRGKIGLDPEASNPLTSIDIIIQVTAPDTAAARLTLGGDLPEMGAVKAQARIIGADGSQSVEDMDIRFGSRNALWVTLTGRIENSSFDQDTPDSGLDFDITIESKKTSQVAAPLGLSLPEIGPVSAKLHFSGEMAKSRLDKLKLQAGLPDRLTISASGSADLGALDAEKIEEMIESVKIDASVVSQTTREVALLLERELPELGPIHTDFSLSGKLNALRVSKGNLKLGSPGLLEISATGRVDRFSIDNPQSFQGLNLDMRLEGPRTSDLTPLAGRPIPDLGPLKGSFTVKGSQKALTIGNIDLSAGRAPVLLMTAEGGIEELRLQDSPAFNKINIRLKMQADSLRRVPAFADTRWSNLGPLSSNGRFTGRHDKIRYTGSVASGKTSSMMDLFLGLDGNRPTISGRITVPVLHPEDIGIDLERDDQPKKGSDRDEPLFGREPLDLDFLETVELALRLDVDEVKGTHYMVSQMHALIGLNDGHLKVKPLKLLYDKSTLSVEAEIEKRTPPRMRLEIIGDDLPAMAAWRHINPKVPLKGDFSLAIDLTSEGHSAHEMASSLNGEFGIMLENAEIARSDLDLLTLDILGWAYRTRVRERTGHIDCLVASFNLNDGLATSETVFLDGPTMILNGKGDINLRDETIDLVLLPKQKKKMFSTTSPIVIKGPLTDPAIRAVPSASAALDYGGIVFAPYIFIPKIALERLWKVHSIDKAEGRKEKSTGCGKARSKFVSSH